jgi:hypothetical protein
MPRNTKPNNNVLLPAAAPATGVGVPAARRNAATGDVRREAEAERSPPDPGRSAARPLPPRLLVAPDGAPLDSAPAVAHTQKNYERDWFEKKNKEDRFFFKILFF